MSSIARETATSQKNASNYFDILEDLLIGYRLPIFTKRAKRKTISHPKFYYFDVGVYQTIRPKGFSDTQDEIDGAALETLFLQTLRAINEYQGLGYQLYYWRTEGGVEVDFIVEGERGFFAFEIKRSKNVSRHDAKGLLSFKKDYPEVKPLLIYNGTKKYYFDDVEVVPMEAMLFELPKLLSDGAR